jgi:hypothetical protein
MLRTLAAVAGGAAMGVVFAASVTTSAAAPSRVIDRTFVCGLAYGSVDIVVSPRGTENLLGRAFTPSSGYVLVTSGQRGDPHSDLVVTARPGFRNPDYRFPAAVYARARRCVAARGKIPLMLGGLPGPPSKFSTESECLVEGRLLVRVRGVLAAPATWRRFDGAFAGVRGRLLEAEIALRDQRTRRPLIFVRIGRTGRTQLWSSPSCA